MAEWIKTTAQKPELYERVLIAVQYPFAARGDYEVTVAHWTGAHWIGPHDAYDAEQVPVFYYESSVVWWMPLPEDPKVEEL